MFTRASLLARHGVQAVFSNREGGCSSGVFSSLNVGFGLGDSDVYVHQNIEMLCEQSGISFPHQARQTHGIFSLYCEGEGRLHAQDADILLASASGVALAVRTADCLPLLLADTQAQVIAAVHAGWKGSVQQVAIKAVEQMRMLGANAERIVASLGPCIDSCCFEVGHDVMSQLNHSYGQGVLRQVKTRYFADLKKVNMKQLLQAGVKAENIEVSSHCTVCNAKPAYYSFRRDQGETGRQLAIIMLS